MKRLFVLLIALCALGGVYARKYEVKTGTFTKLVVPDNLEVVYVNDPARDGFATFEWEDKYADALMFSNNGSGKLTVEVSPDFIGKKLDFPAIYVYSEFLQELESSSEATVTIQELPRCPQLKVTLFGNGTVNCQGVDVNKLTVALMTGHGVIKLKGRAADALYKITGVGRIDASGLEAVKVSCHVFGGGQIHCHPIDEIKLKGLGSTTVYYSGSPAKVKKQGIGKLVHVGDYGRE